MKKYIITSNKYSFCLEGLQKQMNKYWPSNEFTILGFQEPKIKLEKNFNFELLGTNLSDRTPWYKAISPYFEKIKDEHFFLAFEDHFLIDYVNAELFNEGAEIIKNDNTIGKIRLLPKYNEIDKEIKEHNKNFYESVQKKATYTTTSLRPSIWKKSLFNKLIKDPRIITPHQFETVNINGVFNERVLLPKGNYPIFPDLDAMRQGRPNIRTNNKTINCNFYSLNLKEEDLSVFDNVKKIWNNGI